MHSRHLLLALALVMAAPSAPALEPSIDDQVPLRDRMAPGRCDPLDPHYCLFPFPNDYFTVADATTDTGRRVKLNVQSMPANLAGKPVNPFEWNRNDGFSPGSPILVRIPGLDLAQTKAVPITRLSAGARTNQPIVVIDADTLERQLVWAELDDNRTKGTLCTSLDVGSLLGDVLNQDGIAEITDALAVQCRAYLDLPLAPAADPGPALIIRPAKNFKEGHRYIVALRNLKNGEGAAIEAGAAFRIFRDGHESAFSFVNDRRAHMESLFATLEAAGIARDSLYLAWDFTVASQRNLSERMLHIRDQAIASLDGQSPAFAIKEVVTLDPATEPRIAREVHGTVTVPNYLNLPGPLSGSRFNYDPPLDLDLGGDGLPDVNPLAPTWKVPFTCRIPRTAQGDNKARIALYGHGLLGSQGEVGSNQLSDMASEHNFVFCAMDWAGMSEKDILAVARILLDFSLFPTLPDRSQQGFLNFILLGRAMLADDGFTTHPAFRDDADRPILDRRELFFDGNSQGGIYGGALVAVSPDIRAGVLGVPGMNYSLLLQRSVDFDQYAALLYTTYPASLDQQMILALMQMLWDRGEGNGYAQHLGSNPLPNTPPKRVLLHPALGDHQVTTWAADVQARTIGARTNCPAFVGGPDAQAGTKVQDGVNAAVAAEAETHPEVGIGRRHPDDSPLYGIPCIRDYPYPGSAIIYWDSGPLVDAAGEPVATGVAPAPIGNVPPRPELGYGADPHSYPRTTATARQQKSAFLRIHGGVRDVCEGKPCATRGFDTGP
ncbi:MAG TPA: hypothetical protein VJM11_10495 [Nevskiaceae bacterium]|nr:hypothetical protein [Nevskiaceae bacterium]